MEKTILSEKRFKMESVIFSLADTVKGVMETTPNLTIEQLIELGTFKGFVQSFVSLVERVYELSYQTYRTVELEEQIAFLKQYAEDLIHDYANTREIDIIKALEISIAESLKKRVDNYCYWMTKQLEENLKEQREG